MSKLLNKVCYLSRPESDCTDLFGNTIKVKHTFPYNPESKTAPTTAKRWARHPLYDHTTKEFSTPTSVEPLELENTPKKYTIIDLAVRSEGGRAYKVVDEEMRCFDLREDQLLETIKLVGIGSGGRLNGEFVWGTDTSTKLVLVGGRLHTEMVEESNRLLSLKKAGSVKPSELVIGGIYKKKAFGYDSLWVYVGRARLSEDSKALYGFANLPLQENAESIKSYLKSFEVHCAHLEERIETIRQKLALSESWEQLSWCERVQKSVLHEFKATITFFSTPKFEDLVESDVSLAELLLQTATYFEDGNRKDIVETWWHTKNAGPQPWNISYFDWCDRTKKSYFDDNHTEFRSYTMAQYQKAITQFKLEFKWL